MTSYPSNKFAPDGTQTIFKYFGPNSKYVHPITGEVFDITPEDTLLFEQTMGSSIITTNPLIKYTVDDPTIHRLRSECPNCKRPVRVHRIVNGNSILSCRCEYIESIQSPV